MKRNEFRTCNKCIYCKRETLFRQVCEKLNVTIFSIAKAKTCTEFTRTED